jgi:nitroimidazol reductase NimA-like FMN-containing flavoprotein (pyridoxamine 5'-phosphate oxidase superfamily)
MAALSEEVKRFIDRPNFAHLATVMADGSPLVKPVWIGREGDRVIICTSDESLMAEIQSPTREVALARTPPK